MGAYPRVIAGPTTLDYRANKQWGDCVLLQGGLPLLSAVPEEMYKTLTSPLNADVVKEITEADEKGTNTPHPDTVFSPNLMGTNSNAISWLAGLYGGLGLRLGLSNRLLFLTDS